MESSAQACTQVYFGHVEDAPATFLESEINGALQIACASINHVGTVASGIASESAALQYALVPEEDVAISSLASATRRANWTRGRVAAHIALGKLGTAEGAVGRGKAGEPIWPDGISGSISHCAPWSVAAATQSSHCVFLGIDLEDTQRIRIMELRP
jgi:4'-phosphopantetheinyl transferase EntD